MFSIVATETSVLTFVSVPGLAYRSDWFFLQLAMGYILGRVLVSIFLLPNYFKGNIVVDSIPIVSVDVLLMEDKNVLLGNQVNKPLQWSFQLLNNLTNY